MRLEFADGYLDYDLDLFWEVAEPINTKVQQILANRDPELADVLDYADTAEQLIGVALAAAQVYFIAVSRYHGVSKDRTLDLGPTHSSGHSIARLIHHGANFWKHADEWNWDAPNPQATRIMDAFRDLGMPDAEFSLIRMVSSLTAAPTADLGALRPLLEAWRTAVEETFPEAVSGAT